MPKFRQVSIHGYCSGFVLFSFDHLRWPKWSNKKQKSSDKKTFGRMLKKVVWHFMKTFFLCTFQTNKLLTSCSPTSIPSMTCTMQRLKKQIYQNTHGISLLVQQIFAWSRFAWVEKTNDVEKDHTHTHVCILFFDKGIEFLIFCLNVCVFNAKNCEYTFVVLHLSSIESKLFN